jgi:hypothetical protein
MLEEATMWREKLLEAVSEYDDKLMEKFLMIQHQSQKEKY